MMMESKKRLKQFGLKIDVLPGLKAEDPTAKQQYCYNYTQFLKKKQAFFNKKDLKIIKMKII